MNDLLNILKAIAEQVNNLPVTVLMMIVLVVLGSMIKISNYIHNRFIPILLIIAGGGLNFIFGNIATVEFSQRNPDGILILRGICMGFGAWLFHKVVLRRTKANKFMPVINDNGDTEHKSKSE